MSRQEDLLLAVAGSSILTIGLLALWAHFASALSRDRILLWFGLFAAPYGVALLSRTLVLSGPDQQSGWWMAILGRMVMRPIENTMWAKVIAVVFRPQVIAESGASSVLANCSTFAGCQRPDFVTGSRHQK
jgi:hypothetical protein